jgi:hypothetical protein
MLKLKANPTFKAKVGIPIPGGDPVDVTFEFKAMARSKLKAFGDDMKDKENSEFLLPLVVGWDGVEAPYSQEALSELLDQYIGSGRVIWDTYVAELTASRSGN